MDDWFPSADLINGVGLPGVLVGLIWLISRGSLATGRELREKNEEITWLRAALDESTEQNTLILREQGPTITQALTGIRDAAPPTAPEDGGGF